MSQTPSHALAQLSRLRTQVPHALFHFKGDPSYEDINVYYNRALESTPLAIIRPRSESDVSKIVAFCSITGMQLAVRSGGHDFFGRSLAPDGLVVDMRDIDFVNILPDNNAASIGGGIIAGPLQQALEERGFFTPTGQAKTVGYVSWACGGGYGFYVGSYGFGVDQILGARVVLADGSVVDTDEDKEILWSLRGAGAGTLCVVVELRIRIYPTPTLFAGFLGFPLAEAATVLERFKGIVSEEGIPDEFSGDAIIAWPEMLKLPGSQPCLIFYWCWKAVGGDITPARVYLKRMKCFGTVLIDTVQQTTPASFGGGDSSSSTFFRSCTIPSLEPRLGEIFERHLPPQPLAAVVVHYNHGLDVRRGLEDGVGTIFGRRQPHVILGFHGGTNADPCSTHDALPQATNWVKDLMEGISSSGSLLNPSFPGFSPQEEVDPVTFFGPEAADRLIRLKRRVDSGDIFCRSCPRLSQAALQDSL